VTIAKELWPKSQSIEVFQEIWNNRSFDLCRTIWKSTITDTKDREDMNGEHVLSVEFNSQPRFILNTIGRLLKETDTVFLSIERMVGQQLQLKEKQFHQKFLIR